MILQNSTDVKTEIFYDENKDPALVDVRYEKHIVNPNGLIQLQNIPSPLHTVFDIRGKDGVTVIKYNKVEVISNKYDFTVDYINGILTFHNSQKGKEVQISYTNSIGRLSISADRIFTGIDNQGNITQTLGTLLEEGRQTLSDLEVLGGATKVITEIEGYIESIKQLTGNIIEGENVNTELKKSTDTAKSTNTTLNSTINNANNQIDEMNSWVESHSDIVNLDNRVDTAEIKIDTTITQLADMATVNIRQFPRLDSEIDDAPRFQRAFDYLKGKIGIIKLNAERYYFKTKNATGDCFVKVYPNIDLIGIGEKTIIYLDNNTHNGTSGIFKCLDMHDSNYENFVVDTTAITLVDDTDFYDLFYFRYDSTVTTHFNVKIKNVYTKGKAFQSTFNIGTLNDKEVVNFASGLLVENCIIQQQGYATCLNDITYKNVTWVVDLDVLRPSYLNNSTQTPVKFSGKSSFINGAKLLDCKMLVTGTRLPFNPIEVFRTDNGIIDNLEIISTKNGSIVVTSSAGTKLSDYGSVDKETKLTIKNSKLSNVNIVVGELGNVLAENCSFSNCSNLINSTFVEANKENNGVSYTKATFKNVVIYDSCNRLCVSANGKTYISFENCNIYYDRGKSSNGGFNVNPKCEFKIIGTTIWINGTGGGYLLSSSGSDDISFLNTIIMNGNYTSDSTTMLYLTGTHNSIKFINVKNVVRRASTNFLDKSTATISKEIIFNAE